jgi:lipase chaperone LimK
MNGGQINEISHTYSLPQTAKELLDEYAAKELDVSAVNKAKSDVRLNDMMENIINNRMGVDREQLKKIEAMMAKIAENEDLSPEQKEQAIKALEAQKQEIVEESLDVSKQAKQSFNEDKTQ